MSLNLPSAAMRSGLFVALVTALTSTLVGMPAQAAGDPETPRRSPVLVDDVRVLDLSQQLPLVIEDASVLIVDGRIARVDSAGAIEAPTGAVVIDGAGRTLMPGLVDMHVHVWDEAELGAYLAHGVTTVRNASGMPFHLDLQARIAAGALTGPRLITTGPILNGSGPNAQINHQIVDTPEAARAAVQWQHDAGFRRVKVYSNLSSDAYDAIRETADEYGMTLMGHSPEGVREPGMPHERPFNIPFEAVLDDGFVTLEHIETVVWHGLRDDLDEDKARALARRIAAAGVPVDPTLLAFYSLMRVAETKGAYLERPGVELLNPFIVEQQADSFARWSAEDAESAARYFDFYKRATRIFQEEGVVLVTGTDAGIFTNVPGESLVTEMALLRDAGLSSAEVLRAATYNAAVALDESDTTGRVAPGYRADLILVDGDPLQDPGLAGRPSGMILDGRFLSGADLNQLRDGAVLPPYDRTVANVMSGLAAQSQ